MLPGGVLVVETPSRATAGAHYTPKSLATEVVQHALEPLVYDPGPAPAGRRLGAGRLRPDPRAQGRRHRLRLGRVPRRGGPVPRRPARRGVAARGGRDRHDAARTGDPRDPHRHRHLPVRRGHQRDGRGDVQAVAVAGVPRPEAPVLLRRRQDPARQLAARPDRRAASSKRQHIDPDAAQPQQSLFEADVDGVLRQATRLRRQLASEVNDNDPQRSTNTKRRQWHRYQEITAELTRDRRRA